MLLGCSNQTADQVPSTDNPFFESYGTRFNVQPFDRIAPEHFVPAFEEAMRRQKAEHQAIIDNPESPTFANTIAAVDRSGELLGEVSAVFFGLAGSNTSEAIQEIRQEMSPRLAAHRDELRLNRQLIERVGVIYETRGELSLDAEQLFLLENMYRQYVRDGALLNDKEQTRLKEINQALSSLQVTFSDNLLAETNAFELVIEDERELSGLPETVIETAADAATAAGFEHAWLFTTHKPSMLPFLTYAENRELRRQLFTAYTMRGNNGNEHDNTGIVADIINLRVERARLLGYDTYADYVLESRMAKTLQRVYDLLDRLWAASLPVAENEVVEMQQIIDREDGGFKLATWDWWYYAEKLRKQKYELDDTELRPYFELEQVREGAFWVANQLYGLTFERVENLPKPHPEAQVFEVKEADGSHCAILYLDFHPRASKRQGAWCTGYRRHVTFRTVFRSTDFSELPSQIMEHWAVEPEVMHNYARHYRTGEPIPDLLVKKINSSMYFNQGFATVEYLAASLLDMKYHTLTEPTDLDVVKFETEYFNEIGLIPEIVSRYRSSYFAHIIGSYAAGYYGYIWCGVLDSDAFAAFKETSLFDRETAQRFRTTILERNGTADFLEMYRDFRGREPDIEPLLRDRGLM